jgi:hypothetical protein
MIAESNAMVDEQMAKRVLVDMEFPIKSLSGSLTRSIPGMPTPNTHLPRRSQQQLRYFLVEVVLIGRVGVAQYHNI